MARARLITQRSLAGLDTAAARRAPGVLAVLIAADLGELGTPIPIRVAPLPGFERYLQWPLARDRVRYAGEPLALVVAEDRDAAEDAGALVAVAGEPLEAVVDPREAAADRVLVHEASGTNVASSYRVLRGDPDAAFAAAPYTRRETFRSQRHTGVPLETRGLVATWDRRVGTLTVLGAPKVTFFNRRALARMLGLDEAQVEPIEVDVGGGFGMRGEFPGRVQDGDRAPRRVCRPASGRRDPRLLRVSGGARRRRGARRAGRSPGG